MSSRTEDGDVYDDGYSGGGAGGKATLMDYYHKMGQAKLPAVKEYLE